MSTNKTDRDNWRKFLGIKEPSTAPNAAKFGVNIGAAVGRSGGVGSGGAIDSDTIPEGDDEQGAEKGDGAADFGEKLKVGDEFDRAEDLYDCETGEEVTLDGFGEKGSERYPTGFQDCKEEDIDPSYEDGYVWYLRSTKGITGGPIESDVISYHQTKSQALAATWQKQQIQDFFKGDVTGSTAAPEIDGCYQIGCVILGTTITKVSCSGATDPAVIAICNLPPPKNKWPAVDRNHLTWNKEKGCFEPLCHELNTQVLDKYKTCEPERILCDKDGNKVKVTIDGDTVKVTQAKYNQTAEVKNGKVVAVKKLTESQTEAEFK